MINHQHREHTENSNRKRGHEGPAIRSLRMSSVHFNLPDLTISPME
jgi:hypothetical protein